MNRPYIGETVHYQRTDDGKCRAAVIGETWQDTEGSVRATLGVFEPASGWRTEVGVLYGSTAGTWHYIHMSDRQPQTHEVKVDEQHVVKSWDESTVIVNGNKIGPEKVIDTEVEGPLHYFAECQTCHMLDEWVGEDAYTLRASWVGSHRIETGHQKVEQWQAMGLD